MKYTKLTAFISIFALVLLNAAYAAEPRPTNRPAKWAKPIQTEGIPNLHKVSDTLYRSAQPSAEGMKKLKAMGIETVVNLRSFHSDRDEIGDTGLADEGIPMKAWHPEEEDAVRFLRIVTNPKRAPVLIHCQHGADRTGTMCALYRVAVQGWSKEEAVREMTQGGFGFHGIWENLVHWMNGLDIDGIKKKAGIK
jgi:protein tyrosine/serine phosphatase